MTISEITKPGTHFITEPIKVKSGARIFGPGSRLIGGVRISVTNVLDDGIFECDLSGQGVNLSGFVSRGVYRGQHPSHSELFINSRPANISRYPKNDEFLKITEVGDPTTDARWNSRCGKLEGGFFYDDDRPNAWKESSHIWVHGYWSWDWAATKEHIDIFDKKKKFIRTHPPYGSIQYKIGQRFCFFNIREEVTEPGDYFLDLDNNKVYFKPFEDTDINTAELILSSCDKPVFDLNRVSDVLIEGFTVESFRGNGIQIKNSKDVVIKNCTLRNIGNSGIIVNGSENVYVRGCHIHHTGDSGIKFQCGNRKTLAAANCGVEDSRLHHISCWDTCYEPPVVLQGVGISVRRNIIHDCPHSAIVYQGNDMKITDNEIFRVVMQTSDAGAIYAGRNYTFRGNEICRNFFHDIGDPSIPVGIMAIYEDDCISGTRIDNNVFCNIGRGILMGGGVDFEVNGNVFVNCNQCITLDGRGQFETPFWRNMVGNVLRESFYAVNADRSPYTKRYPELKKIDRLYKSEAVPHIPPSMHASGNIFCSSEPFHISEGTEDSDIHIEDNNISLPFDEIRKHLSPRQAAVICDDEE